MRAVALALAVAVIGAWVGLVSVGTVQAHGGIANTEIVDPASCPSVPVPAEGPTCVDHDK